MKIKNVSSTNAGNGIKSFIYARLSRFPNGKAALNLYLKIRSVDI